MLMNLLVLLNLLMLFKVGLVRWALVLLIIGLENQMPISFLSGIPFGMNYQEMSSWFYNGDGIKLADEVYNQF